MHRLVHVPRASFMTSMTPFTILLLLAGLFSLVGCVPLTERDVPDPPITSPTAATVWNVGENQTVTWDVSGLPPNITNPAAMLVLGFLQDGDPSEHLMLNPPLAQGFLITDAKVTITVPSVPARNDYIVVLFGDSGNISPEFTINNGTSTSSSSSTSRTSSSTTATVTSTVVTTPRTTVTTLSTAPPASSGSAGAPASPPASTPTSPAASTLGAQSGSGSGSPLSATPPLPTVSSPSPSPAAQTQGSNSKAAVPMRASHAALCLAPLLFVLLML